MSSHAYISNLPEFKKSIDNFAVGKVSRELDLATKMVAQELIKELKYNSPVISGHLRGKWSNVPKKISDGVYEISNSAKYVWYVELGPHGQPSLGFVRRTVSAFDSKVDSLIRQTLQRVIRDLNQRKL